MLGLMFLFCLCKAVCYDGSIWLLPSSVQLVNKWVWVKTWVKWEWSWSQVMHDVPYSLLTSEGHQQPLWCHQREMYFAVTWVAGYFSGVRGDRLCRQWCVMRGHILVGAQPAWACGQGKSRASQTHTSVKDRGDGSEILDLQSGSRSWFPFFFLQAPRENALFVGAGTPPSRKSEM